MTSFITRALNHSRAEFLPTYVGLRLMLSQIRKQEHKEFFTNLVLRKGTKFRDNRYRSHTIYKDIDEDGTVEYRHCLAASPFALLQETFVLEHLAADPAFSIASNVFSYLWPSAKSGNSFQYYFNGYIKRNNAIRNALTSNQNMIVALFDLRRFYPTVIKADVREELSRRLLKSSLDPAIRRILMALAEGYLAGSKTGIPIGPPFSHWLANLAMSKFDRELESKHPGRYFRYVDDLAIVTTREHANDVTLHLTDLFGSRGYSINDRKTRTVDRSTAIDIDTGSVSISNIGILRQAIAILLSVSPNLAVELKSALMSEGFNLPIAELNRMAAGAGWRVYLHAVISSEASFESLRIALGGIAGVVKYAKRLRDELRVRLETFEKSKSERGLTNMQEFRQLIGAMLYMYPLKELGTLERIIGDEREVVNIKALVNCCNSSNVSNLLWYPGKTVSTFAQLWASGSESLPTVDWQRNVAPPQRDAAAHLALSGLIEIPDEIISNGDDGLLRFCSQDMPSKREYRDFSYDDELRSLQIGLVPGAVDQLIKTRYDVNERDSLDGLLLGGGYYQ